jgi:hypothetical protein
MLMRLFAIVVLSLALFAGCTNTRQAQQDDSKSILRKADSGQEIHGELGAMYGCSTGKNALSSSR